MRNSLLIVAVFAVVASLALVGTATADQPEADFTYTPEDPLNGQEVEFDASEATSEDGISSYEWELGDDTLEDGMVVNHTYEKTGLYEVTLVVKDNNGDTDEVTKDVQVAAIRTPTADFTYEPEEPLAGREVVFDASPAAEQSVEIVAYEWETEGKTVTTEETTFEHTFDRKGSYDVSLRVVNDQGNEDTMTKEVAVEESLGSVTPVAVMNISKTDVAAGEEVRFESESYVTGGEIDGHRWTIDGEVFREESFNYTFKEEKEYKVELEVTTSEGFTDTATEEILVVGEVIGTDDDGGDDGGTSNASGDDVGEEGLPGFGFVASLLAVAFVAVVARRSR